MTVTPPNQFGVEGGTTSLPVPSLSLPSLSLRPRTHCNAAATQHARTHSGHRPLSPSKVHFTARRPPRLSLSAGTEPHSACAARRRVLYLHRHPPARPPLQPPTACLPTYDTRGREREERERGQAACKPVILPHRDKQDTSHLSRSHRHGSHQPRCLLPAPSLASSRPFTLHIENAADGGRWPSFFSATRTRARVCISVCASASAVPACESAVRCCCCRPSADLLSAELPWVLK